MGSNRLHAFNPALDGFFGAFGSLASLDGLDCFLTVGEIGRLPYFLGVIGLPENV
jgi:hypothetical protein